MRIKLLSGPLHRDIVVKEIVDNSAKEASYLKAHIKQKISSYWRMKRHSTEPNNKLRIWEMKLGPTHHSRKVIKSNEVGSNDQWGWSTLNKMNFKFKSNFKKKLSFASNATCTSKFENFYSFSIIWHKNTKNTTLPVSW